MLNNLDFRSALLASGVTAFVFLVFIACVVLRNGDVARQEHALGAGLDLRRSCGARGDANSDDSAALKSCLLRLEQMRNAGLSGVLRIPAGIYRITGANGVMPLLSRSVTILGDGPHASYIVLDPSYTGELFSWSEAWIGRNFGPNLDVTRDASGATIEGLQIIGAIDASPPQTAFAFYDRNDHVLLRDIEVQNLGGQCLTIGRSRLGPVAYTRESSFYNFKCYNAGSKSLAAIEIGSSTAKDSDATNELDFYKLAVFDAKGAGVAIGNRFGQNATRKVRFFGLRVEKTGGDAVAIAADGGQGQVAEIGIFDLSIMEAGEAALRIGDDTALSRPYAISVTGGLFGPGNRQGIVIKSGRLIDISLSAIDAPVVLGPGTGSGVSIRGNGIEYRPQYEGENSKAKHLNSP